MKYSLFSTWTLTLSLATLALCAQEVDMSKLDGMKFRHIGPAGMSGRVTAIDVVESNTSQIYIGTASGGLWMSQNEGINWKPLFDEQPVASIGDIAIYQKNPSIIYVGTGEGNPRNSQSSGNGMYKTLDGGQTWKHLGLKDSRNIHRVIVDPDDSDIVYAGVQGPAWAPTASRGVYKSTDGGKNWDQVLFVNDTTGVADMVMDPTNPNKIIVAMWQFLRRPWYMESGGQGSGIYITMDGGETWDQVKASQGIPNEHLGRIGLAIAESSPNVVYARIEAKKDGFYRSDDGGKNWRLQANENIGDRPFYYSDIFVDPTNENRIYNLSSSVIYSEDGGKTHHPLMSFFQVHPDHHAWWINPHDPSHMLNGNDGGLYSTRDKGKSWKFHHNIPVGQFYHVSVDNEVPYNVMGGMQDNGSWSGPAYKFEMMGSIRNNDFASVGFGDGFDVIADPDDSRYGYSLWQGGRFMRYDKKLSLIKAIAPVTSDDTKLRWHWNAAIAQDPWDNSTIYVGSQFVHRTTNKGLSWETMSPDLTTNDPTKQLQASTGGLTIDNTTAENHTTLLVIEPSALERGLIWSGSDDGQVHITRDKGETWTNVTANIPGLPKTNWVTQIKASTHDAGTAFAVFDDHRRNNWEPYVYMTTDYGSSWTSLVNENDVWGYALSFAQDPVEPALMFVGTEFGLYVSINSGDSWTKWKKDLPTCSVMDMVIHPREHDLVLGTFGRSVWILDDIRPLREMAQDTAVTYADLHIFETPDSYQAVIGMPAFFSGSSDQFTGANRPAGAMISYWSKDKTGKDSVIIEIKDADGEVFRELKTTAKPGLNRLQWDLKKESAKYPGPQDMFASFFSQGMEALPGDYQFKVTMGEHTDSTIIIVKEDPQMPISIEALTINLERKARFQEAVRTVGKSYDELEETDKQLNKLSSFIADREDSTAMRVMDSLKVLQKNLNSLKLDAVPLPSKGITVGTDDLVSQLQELGFYFFSVMSEPGEPEGIMLDKIEGQVADYDKSVKKFMDEDYEKFVAELNAAGLTTLQLPGKKGKS